MVTDKKYGVLEEIGAQGRGRLMAERKWNAEARRQRRGALRLIGLGKNWELHPCWKVVPSFFRSAPISAPSAPPLLRSSEPSEPSVAV